MNVICCAVRFIKISSPNDCDKILKIPNNGRTPRKIWQIVVGMLFNQKSFLQQYIFGIKFQGDGTEEVIACSWDGQTYIVNLQKEVVRFHFRENVAAFCAGMTIC